MDEGVGFVTDNNEYSFWIALYTDIPKFRPASWISEMENPEYDRWVRGHEIERLAVSREVQGGWKLADSVRVNFTYLEDTSVLNFGCVTDSYAAGNYESIPKALRLANREYSFFFHDTFQWSGTRLRIQYALKRPDKSREEVDTIIAYRWQEYEYAPY
jgi:hypothetical protein